MERTITPGGEVSLRWGICPLVVWSIEGIPTAHHDSLSLVAPCWPSLRPARPPLSQATSPPHAGESTRRQADRPELQAAGHSSGRRARRRGCTSLARPRDRPQSGRCRICCRNLRPLPSAADRAAKRRSVFQSGERRPEKIQPSHFCRNIDDCGRNDSAAGD